MIIYPDTLIEEYVNGSSTVKLSEKYNIHHATIRDYLVRNGIVMRSNKDNSRRYSVNHEAFSSIDSEKAAYWLGFLYADGYVSSVNGKRVGLSLATKDEGHIVKFADFIQSNYPIGHYMASGYSNSKYSRLIIASDKMYDDLVKHGVVEHKTTILKYPTDIPDELERHFIRGYVDGDGCVTYNGNSYSMSVVSTNDFLDGCIDFFNRKGVYKHSKRENRFEECPAISLRLTGETAYLVMKLLYEESSVYLDRKYERVQSAINYFSRLYQQ